MYVCTEYSQKFLPAEKHVPFSSSALMGEMFIPWIFLSHVKDYIEPIVIFTGHNNIIIRENLFRKSFPAKFFGCMVLYMYVVFSLMGLYKTQNGAKWTGLDQYTNPRNGPDVEGVVC